MSRKLQSPRVTVQEIVSFGRESYLSGRIFEPEPRGSDRRAVLFVHGLASSQQPYESRAQTVSQRLAAVCLTFDLRGHGRDSDRAGQYSICDHVDDVVAAYDALVAQATVDPGRVGVCGASYGAYLAAVLTSRRAVKRLVLRAPALAQDLMSFTRHGVLRSAPDCDAFDSLAILRRYDGEVLLIESERDEVIPASNIAAYAEACRHAQQSVIPDATHALRDERWNQIFVDAIVRCFDDL